MSQYGPGTLLTVDTTQGETLLTFSSECLLLTEVNRGDWFTIDDDTSPTFELQAPLTNITAHLTAAWSGNSESGASFVISRDFTSRKNYPIFRQGDKRVAKNLARLVSAIDDDMSTVGTVSADTTTNNVSNYDLVYYSAANNVVDEADATDLTKPAIAVVSRSGFVKQAGQATINIESGIAISRLDKLYLSTSAGKITNICPTGGANRKQLVGIAVEDGSVVGGTVGAVLLIDCGKFTSPNKLEAITTHDQSGESSVTVLTIGIPTVGSFINGMVKIGTKNKVNPVYALCRNYSIHIYKENSTTFQCQFDGLGTECQGSGGNAVDSISIDDTSSDDYVYIKAVPSDTTAGIEGYVSFNGSSNKADITIS